MTRFIFPILITLSGVGAVLYYESTTRTSFSDTPSIASIGFVQSVSGFHLRQQKDSKMWAPLQRGDQLYPFDEIKTGAEGDLKLAIPSVAKAISVESDSHILLEADSGLVTVKTTEGLFTIEPMPIEIHSSKTPERKISVADESAANCAVPESTTTFVKQGSEAVKPLASTAEILTNFHNIIWKSPAVDTNFELNPDFPQAHQFSWEGSRPDWLIELEWGPSRRLFTEKRVAESQTQLIDVTIPIGKHFWRWKVIEKTSAQVLYTSPTYRLNVQGVFAPAVIGPSGEWAVRVDDPNESIDLKWVSDPSFVQYDIEFSRSESFSDNLYTGGPTGGNSVEVKPGKFGLYFWRVTGIRTIDGRVVKSKAHSFRFLSKDVEKIKMQWITFEGIEQFYSGKQPFLKLQWAATPSADKIYRVKVRPAEGGPGRILTKTVRSTETIVEVDKPGAYVVSVLAFNEDSDTVGSLDELHLSVSQKPPLHSPKLVTTEPEATSSGKVYLRWENVEGAAEYHVEIRAPDGMIFSHASRYTSIELKKLFPGTYSFRVNGVDQAGNLGDPSDSGRFVIPEKSSLRAPKLKKMEVE
jgi:hypothetical protein